MVFISVTVFERKPHDPRSRETVTVARSTNARTDIPSSRVSLFASPLPLFVSSTPLRIMELLRGRGGHRGLPNIPRALPSFLTRYDLYCPLRACAFFPSIHRRCSRALAALNLNDDRRIESKNAMILQDSNAKKNILVTMKRIALSAIIYSVIIPSRLFVNRLANVLDERTVSAYRGSRSRKSLVDEIEATNHRIRFIRGSSVP